MYAKLSLNRAVAIPTLTTAIALFLFCGYGMLAAEEPIPVAPPQEAAAAGEQDQSEVEHLLRGPLHEAFAEPVNFDPKPTLIVPKKPPEPIDEMPPETKPEGDAIWISGYWAWDDERDDFLWVSGGYRIAPPDRRWVPGYWQAVEGGYQWTAGFWAAVETNEVDYLPQPPESVERGPSSPAPSDDYFWVNGYWHYDGRYLWRPGYWTVGREGWVWIPAQYIWTHRGCVFVPGYWDYQLIDRGICFAPVYWRRPIYTHVGYYYRPIHVIDLNCLNLHLFVRPGYCHYYYGDWYGGSYRNRGIYASFNFHGHRGYDPLWTYNRWHYGRQGIDYDARVHGWHTYFDKHKDRRPPHTWNEQKRFVEHHRDYKHLDQVVIGEDVREFAAKHPQKFKQVGEDARRRMRDDAKQMRNIANVRRDAESKDRHIGEKRPVPEMKKQRFMLPETPDVRHAREQISKREHAGKGSQSDSLRRTGVPPLPQARAHKSALPEQQKLRLEKKNIQAGKPRIEQPRVDIKRTEKSRVEQKRVDQPPVERKRIETPKLERKQVEKPPVERKRIETPKLERKQVEQPRVERKRNETPKLERKQVEQPRVERKRVESPPVERKRIESPKVERKQVEQPRVERKRVEQPRVERKRVEQPRVERKQAPVERRLPEKNREPRVEKKSISSGERSVSRRSPSAETSRSGRNESKDRKHR